MNHAAVLGELLGRDPRRSRIVAMVASSRLPYCWIGAGLLRNAVCDHLHGRAVSAPVRDIDVICDPARADAAADASLERRLEELDPLLDWSVKNQCRMHVRNGDAAYTSCGDAMRH